MIWLSRMGWFRVAARSKSEAALVLLGALTFTVPTHAQGTSADELARRHFESGVAYLEESDYDHALEAFQKAYDLSKRPEILLNLATVEERRSNVAGALSALRQYLNVVPSGAHVETVKLRIQNLEKREPSQAVAAPAPSEPVEAKPPPAAPPPVAAAPTAQGALVLSPAPSRPSRVPVFIALGTGAIAAGLSVLTGVLANSEYNDAETSCGPRCSDSELSTGRTLAVTSTLLTGVAIVGAGVGITLLVLEPGGDSAVGSRRLELGLRPNLQGGSAEAAWRF